MKLNYCGYKLFLCTVLFFFTQNSIAGAPDSKKARPGTSVENQFANVVAGSSPDNSHQVLCNAIDQAKESIEFTGYMLRSDFLADHFVAAAKRGVKITMLLDGWPVAKPKNQKIDEQELYIAKRISESGGKVIFMASDMGSRSDRRFRYVHSKYAIIDKKTVYVSSENFSSNSGHPVGRTTGNRGWSITIENKDVADMYREPFLSDIEGRKFNDLVPYGKSSDYTLNNKQFTPDRTVENGNYKPVDPSKVSEYMSVERVMAPDDTLATNRSIINAIKNARHKIVLQNLSFAPHWGTEQDTADSSPSPLAEAILDAARRGVSVRMMLNPLFFGSKPGNGSPGKGEDGGNGDGTDGRPSLIAGLSPFIHAGYPAADNSGTSSSTNGRSSKDNEAAIEYFRGQASKEGLDLQASLFWVDELNLKLLHNKGMVIDDDKTLISSINFVENALTSNREAGVIVTSPKVASYYRALFDRDWKYNRSQK